MKINRIFPIFLLATFFWGLASCKDSKKDSPDQKENTEVLKDNSKMEIENGGERQAMPEDAAGVGPAAQTGGSTGASNNLKMSAENPETGAKVNLDALYSELEMTEEQIKKFKTSMGNEQLNTLQNTSGELPGNLYANMESELESILDNEQFQKYQVWKKGQ